MKAKIKSNYDVTVVTEEMLKEQDLKQLREIVCNVTSAELLSPTCIALNTRTQIAANRYRIHEGDRIVIKKQNGIRSVEVLTEEEFKSKYEELFRDSEISKVSSKEVYEVLPVRPEMFHEPNQKKLREFIGDVTSAEVSPGRVIIHSRKDVHTIFPGHYLVKGSSGKVSVYDQSEFEMKFELIKS